MDERSQKIIARGMAITLTLLYLYLFVTCVWKYAVTNDITNITWELILIIMIPASIWWFARKDESLMIPKMSTTGEEIPTGSDDKSMKKRRGYYLREAIGLATAFLILTIADSLFIQKNWDYFILFPQWNDQLNIIFILFLEFMLSVIIFYAIAYVWDEWTVKRYNRKLNELEEYE